MSKKRAKTGFIILSIVLAIGLFLTFFSFNVPFTYSTYNGFYNSLAVGTDLAGGQSSVYECALNTFNGATDFDAEMDKTISSLQVTLHGMGYNSAIVSKENNNKIRIETAKSIDMREVDGYIGSYASIYITSQAEEDFDVSNPTGTYISAKDITSVSNSFAGAQNTFNIMLYFNNSGTTKYNEITKEASAEGGSGYVYIYVIDADGELVQINNDSNYINLECTAESTDNYLGFSSNGFTNQNSANVYTLPFVCATYGVTMELVETEEITPVLGSSALICITIAVFVAFAAAILLLVYRYGDFGWLAGLCSIFFLVMNMFLLQAIPNIFISMGSLFALILTYFLLFDGFIIIFEKIRDEYRLGKKMHLSVRGGYKKAVWPIVDVNIIVAILGLFLCFFSSSVLISIGFIFLVGSILNVFTTLVLSKLVAEWYLALNSTKAKRVHLKRDKSLVINDEIVINPDNNGGDK